MKNGIMDELDITKIKLNQIEKELNKNAKSQGNNLIQKLYTWKYDNKHISCYGWHDGEAGFENKHDLPSGGGSQFLEEDSSVKLLYGDIFMVCWDKKKIYDFHVSDYGEFYNIVFEGFDDCNSETESEYEEEEEEDEDYVGKESEDESELIKDEYLMSESDKELEEDDNEY